MVKNNIIDLIKSWWLVLLVALLYITGYHTPVIGALQQALLYTGLFNPTAEDAGGFEPANYNLTLIDSSGHTVSLEEFRGQAVFINFWASWCAPCLAEMPGIAKASNETSGKVKFLLITVEDNADKAEALIKKKGYPFEVYRVVGDRPTQYQSNQVPTTYVVNSIGQLVLSHKGMAQYGSDEFIDWLHSL